MGRPKMMIYEIELMLDTIEKLTAKHGVDCGDGHWMTEDELYALSEERILKLYAMCMERNH